MRCLGFMSAALFAFCSLASTTHAQNCAQTSVGSIPINDLGTGLYNGFEGGLYPGGTNVRPAAHEAAGITFRDEVVPRDASGNPDPLGSIGFISIGMSNTRNHFTQFVPIANADADKAPEVVVVNAAQGGQPAEDIDDPLAPYWNFVDNAVSGAGMTNAQVQVVWMLQANRANGLPGFPTHAQNLRDQLITICMILRDRFPNLKQVFLGSRIYAGYATTQLNPEPFAYENGFSLKWLIEEQINGNADLNYDPMAGPVESAWIDWSAYAWADGLMPRSDGLTWECSDFNMDGTHPSIQGSMKMADIIHQFMRGDVTTTWWYGQGPPPTGLFEAACFGDGGDQMGCTTCPCGNNAPQGSGGGCLNSASNSTRLVGSGTPSVSNDTLRFELLDGLAGGFTVLLSGAALAPQNPANPCFGQDSGVRSQLLDGLRCSLGAIQRHGGRAADSNGDVGLTNNGWGDGSGPPAGLLAQGGFGAGQTRHFQVNYREFSHLGCMRGLNSTNAFSIEVLP